MESRLQPLQRRVLSVLAGMEPPWTLTGGGALAFVHLGHRDTKDLDLFFHGLRALDHLPGEVAARLGAAGLQVESMQTATAFHRFRVSDEHGASTLIDLVAEPVPVIEPPVEIAPGILVDTAYEILVNKVAALYSRWETRDLEDIRALEAIGLDLDRALVDATRKDAGVSPPSLAWALQQFDVRKTAATLGFDAERLASFKDQLVRRLLS